MSKGRQKVDGWLFCHICGFATISKQGLAMHMTLKHKDNVVTGVFEKQ